MKQALLLALLMFSGCSGTPAETVDAPDATPDPEPKLPVSTINETEVVQTYTGAGVGPYAFNTGCEGFSDPGGPENLGGVCIVLPNDTQSVEFTVEDDVAEAAGVYVRFDSGDPAGFFCNEGRFRPPAEASWAMLVVFGQGCLVESEVPAPTTGTIAMTVQHG